MKDDELIRALAALRVPDGSWSKGTAEVWRRAGFICEYCDRPMFADEFVYRCYEHDHILPKSKYQDPSLAVDVNTVSPAKTSNLALCCKLCHYLKGQSFDPNDDGIHQGTGPIEEDVRGRLIERVREYVLGRKREWTQGFEQSKELLVRYLRER